VNTIRRRTFIAGLGAAAWPLPARAQQRAVPLIGLLEIGARVDYLTAAFRQGLTDQGYVEVDLVRRGADNLVALSSAAMDLVEQGVAALFTPNFASARAAKLATKTVPIVFTTGTDPVEFGLVASLNRPGGNITGVSFLTVLLTAKRLQLLHELLPAVNTIGFLTGGGAPQLDKEIELAQAAAGVLGVRLLVERTNKLEAGFAALAQEHVGGLLLSGNLGVLDQGQQLVALAARHGLPTIFPYRESVVAGGLFSYGASLSDAWRLAGTYVGRVLKGEKPSDLPVQQSTRIEMVLNLRTAKALGIEVPTSILLRADEVID